MRQRRCPFCKHKAGGIWWVGGLYLFERIPDAESHGADFFRLAHAVNPAEGLLFDHGVPLRLEEVGGGCGGEI
jgi:hypothetical protein